MNRGKFLPTIISSLGKHQSSAAFSLYSIYPSSENEALRLRSWKISAGAGPFSLLLLGFRWTLYRSSEESVK